MEDETEISGNENIESGTQTTEGSQVEETTTETSEVETQVEGQSGTDEESEKIRQKASDMEKAAMKWKEIASSLKKEMKQVREGTTKSPEEMGDWERLDSMLDKKLADIQGKLEQREQAEVIEEIADMPYTKELGPEIAQKMQEVDANLPFRKRLEIARALAIAENAHIIAEVHLKKGMDTAYGNQKLKKANGSEPSSNAKLTKPKGSISENVTNMSREDYIKNREAIQADIRSRLGM